MLRPEEYTIPGTDAPQLASEQEYQAELVRDARNGNTEASREIYWEFVGAVARYNKQSWSVAVPWAYVQYVADRLQDVLGHPKNPADPGKAAVALGIKDPSPGRPKGKTEYDHKAVAAFFYRLLWEGFEPKAVKSLMRESIGVSEDVTEKAKGDYAAAFAHPDGSKSRSSDPAAAYIDFLEQLAAPYKGKIAEIIAARKSRSG
ncbi:MAG TPA: hypothetical protein VED45_03895 [Steroidobacteraceae bacterium]|nr:hypothetical protein [Steroidobacteraceae bacterium]